MCVQCEMCERYDLLRVILEELESLVLHFCSSFVRFNITEYICKKVTGPDPAGLLAIIDEPFNHTHTNIYAASHLC
jgi:hypothetical protein